MDAPTLCLESDGPLMKVLALVAIWITRFTEADLYNREIQPCIVLNGGKLHPHLYNYMLVTGLKDINSIVTRTIKEIHSLK